MPYPSVDLRKVRTYSLAQRMSKVSLDNLARPGAAPPPFENPELDETARRIADARLAGAPVIWMFGAHVIKRGLGPLLIDLMQRGVITHLASNGAATIHDFEIGLFGQTSEDVATSLEDGSFGMAEETGAFMNNAIRSGARLGLGLGESLGRWIAADDRFQYRQYSVVYHAFRLGVPYTVHVALGTDIIHQHPRADFTAIGYASGQDFKIFTAAVSKLEGGVFCNIGSAVIGPEVFLKALSISRNLGNKVRVFTTANFDLKPLGDYRRPLGDEAVDYYYRPRKNVINRPTSLGGQGFHIEGDHKLTLPTLAQRVKARLGEAALPASGQRTPPPQGWPGAVEALTGEAPQAALILRRAAQDQPGLQAAVDGLAQAFRVARRSQAGGGMLFIAAEPGETLPPAPVAGEEQPVGVRALLLGDLPALPQGLQMAQQLSILARPGDVLLCYSPESASPQMLAAQEVARRMGLPVIVLSGPACANSRLACGAEDGVDALAAVEASPELPDGPARLYQVFYAMLAADWLAERG